MVDTKKATKRGRPRGFDRQEAVSRARALFHQRGYERVGIADLSEALGVNPPSLYAAFGCKAGLFAATVEDYLAREGGFIPETLKRDDPPETLIPALFDEAVRRFTLDGEPLGCMVIMHGDAGRDEAVRALSAEAGANTRLTIMARFEGALGQRAGALADAIYVALSGLSTAARSGVPRERLLPVAELMARSIVAEFFA